MKRPIWNSNKTYHKFSIIIAIFFSMVILPCFIVQADEEIPHEHTYDTTIIINPTDAKNGIMSMYCAECGDFGYYTIGFEPSLNNAEYTQLYFDIFTFLLELFMSSETTSPITPYPTSEQRVSCAIIGIIVLIIISLLKKLLNKEE